MMTNTIYLRGIWLKDTLMRDAAHYIDPYHAYKELTLRGVLLGIIITILFTASNVYLGLKVGLTFASSIPAAVLAMAVLKFFKDSNLSSI